MDILSNMCIDVSQSPSSFFILIQCNLNCYHEIYCDHIDDTIPIIPDSTFTIEIYYVQFTLQCQCITLKKLCVFLIESWHKKLTEEQYCLLKQYVDICDKKYKFNHPLSLNDFYSPSIINGLVKNHPPSWTRPACSNDENIYFVKNTTKPNYTLSFVCLK